MNTRRFLFFVITMISLGATAQDFLFVGVHGIKEANVDYWCQNKTYETKPLQSDKEYNTVKKEFFGRKLTWPSTYLLTPRQAAVIYEVKVKDYSFNCTSRSIGIAYGSTIEAAEAEYNHTIQKAGEKFSSPAILYRWDPLAKQKKYNGQIGGIDLEISRRQDTYGKVIIQLKMTNTQGHPAMVAIVTGKGDLVSTPHLIKPGEALTETVQGITEFDLYVDYRDKATEENSWINDVKQWVREKVTTPAKPDKPGRIYQRFDGTCMCIRG